MVRPHLVRTQNAFHTKLIILCLSENDIQEWDMISKFWARNNCNLVSDSYIVRTVDEAISNIGLLWKETGHWK